MIQFDEHIFQMGWFNHQPELGVVPQIIGPPAEPIPSMVRLLWFQNGSRMFQPAPPIKQPVLPKIPKNSNPPKKKY